MEFRRSGNIFVSKVNFWIGHLKLTFRHTYFLPNSTCISQLPCGTPNEMSIHGIRTTNACSCATI